jgi:hypothetical protein
MSSAIRTSTSLLLASGEAADVSTAWFIMLNGSSYKFLACVSTPTSG